MFSADADLFFLAPNTPPAAPGSFSTLYLLRRDITTCLGNDPDTGERPKYAVLLPGAMAILAGIDLLAKFYAGNDDVAAVGKRFRGFIARYFHGAKAKDQEVIYQLRNALLHSFGLYSGTKKGVYRFHLSMMHISMLVYHRPPDDYDVDIISLLRAFNGAIEAYSKEFQSNVDLQTKFALMFQDYGRIYIS